MVIGVPREIKIDEFRVALLPEAVAELVRAGHKVLVQAGAGKGVGIQDEAYRQSGAIVVGSAEELFGQAELVVKVKEPQGSEIPLLRPRQMLFCFLHLAASRELTLGLLERGVTAFAFETLTDEAGGLPLLAPMSEIAGRLSVLEAAHFLQRPRGGRGVLIGRTAGALPARVLVLGAGVAGRSAAEVAAALGARVVVLDINPAKLRKIAQFLPANVVPLYSSKVRLCEELSQADVVIGAVLVPGARAPILIDREDLRLLKPGSVIVDISIDQGGCVATSRPTTHRDPVFVVDGIIHYCVTNIPSAVAVTSTQALSHTILPWVMRLASFRVDECIRQFPPLARALNTFDGQITHPAVAESFGLPYRPPAAVV